VRTRRLFPFSALLVTLITVTAIAGSYQLTKNGKTLVWKDDDKSGVEVTWSGKRDADGYATGYGTLTWYAPEDTHETGSNVPRTHYKVSSRVSGTMVHGKFAEASAPSTALDSHEPAKPEKKGWLSRIFRLGSKPTPAPVEATPKPRRKSASSDTEETPPQSSPVPTDATAKPRPASTPSPKAAKESLSESMNAPSSLKLSSPAASVSPTPDVSLQLAQPTSPSPTPQ
jgi:hypothetical protein